MGDLIPFPKKRIVRKNPTPQSVETEAKKKKAKENYFIEQLSEEIVLHIIHVLQDNAVRMKDEAFLRDLAVIIESIKSLLRRDFGKPHPMQPITDTLIRIITLPDGKKVSDINYGKIVKYTHTKPKPQPKEEKTVEIDFDFELE